MSPILRDSLAFPFKEAKFWIKLQIVFGILAKTSEYLERASGRDDRN